MGDRELSEMLRRATEPEDPALVNAMLRVVADELSESSDPHPTTRHSGRRRWALAGAAIVLVAMIFGVWVVVSRPQPSGVSTVDSVPDKTEIAPDGPGVRLVPTAWPSMLDGPIKSRAARAVDPAALTSHLLELDGRVAAVAWVTPVPLDPVGGPDLGDPETVTGTIGGHPAVWNDGAAFTTVSVDLAGEHVTLASNDVGLAGLESLVPAFERDAEQVDPSALPTGWNMAEDPAELADALAGETTPATWEVTVRRQGRNTNQTERLELGVRTEPDPVAALDQIAEFAEDTVRRAQLDDGSDVILIGGPGSLIPLTRAFWAPSGDKLAMAIGLGLSDDEIVATIRSAEIAPTDTQLPPYAPDSDTSISIAGHNTVDADAVPIAAGTAGEYRWMLTLTPTPVPEEMRGTEFESGFTREALLLHIIDPNGLNQSASSVDSDNGGGMGANASSISLSGGGGDRSAVIALTAPVGLTRASVRVRGLDVNYILVPLTNPDRTLVLGFVPNTLAQTISDDPTYPAIEDYVVVTGLLSDGSSFTNR